jgi:hypothetical protein
MPASANGASDAGSVPGAVRAVETWEKALARAVHVVADATGATEAAAWLWMQYDRIALGQIGYSLANLFDPACVFVTERKWHLVGDPAEDTLHQVEVRATHSGAGDAHDDIQWTADLRLRNIDDSGWLIELEEPYRLHYRPPCKS